MKLALFIFAATLAIAHSATVASSASNLEKADAFSFGGVGYAGTISNSEKEFMVIYAKPAAAKLFLAVYAKGTVPAKLYCLAAWHEIEPVLFDKFSAELAEQNPKAKEIQGCMIIEQDAREIILHIRKGLYSPYLKKVHRAKK